MDDDVKSIGNDWTWTVGRQSFVANKMKWSENLIKHNVRFKEASSLFTRPNVFEVDSKNSTKTEERYYTSGYLKDGKPLMVGYTRRGDQIRIYTARFLDRHEEREMVAKLRSVREAQQERNRGKERRSKDKTKNEGRELKRDIKERRKWKMRDNMKREGKDRDRDR